MPNTAGAALTIPIRQNLGKLVTSSPQEAAINLLAEFGPSGREALPKLQVLLNDKNQSIRLSAARSIVLIGGDTRKALETVLKILNTLEPGTRSDYSLVRAVEILEDIGPPAREGIPTLLTVQTYSVRAFQSVRAALLRINAR